eukprot:4277780-Amphidinium_carterae.1
MPKKAAAQCFGPATVEMMKYIKEKASERDTYATGSVQRRVIVTDCKGVAVVAKSSAQDSGSH